MGGITPENWIGKNHTFHDIGEGVQPSAEIMDLIYIGSRSK